MYCSKCGAYINEDATICMNCGCETDAGKQKQEMNGIKETENNLKFIFGIVFIVILITTIFFFFS